MNHGVAAQRRPHVHEAGFYGSDAEFRAMIVPFVEDGLAAGEPVILGYDERRTGLLQGWLHDPSAVTFVSGDELYGTPTRAISSYERLFQRHLDAGAPGVRLAGEVPHVGNGGRFEGWDRYEAALNVLWAPYPLRSLCLYDATTVSPAVRDVVERTHPVLGTPSGDRRDNDRYDGTPVLGGLASAPDPIEASAPTAELKNPTPAEARHALEQVADRRVDEQTLTDLVIGVSETVLNARVHGRAPATVRIWAEPERVVVHVSDSGSGPADPLAGLAPVANSPTNSGLGLWLTHQLDVEVALLAGPDGFTVRLRGGRSTPALL